MSSDITVTVKFFAATRDAVGKPRMIKKIPKGATAYELLTILKEQYPQLDKAADQIIVAVNKENSKGDEPLSDGDEVSLLPPVSGG